MNFWCHSCNGRREASLNEISHEFECQTCGGSFVEEYTPQINSFIEPGAPPESGLPHGDQAEGDPSLAVLQHIVGRVLGMDVQVGPQPTEGSTLLSVLQSAAQRQTQGSGPVGVIIRQPASIRQLDSLSSLLGGSTGGMTVARLEPVAGGGGGDLTNILETLGLMGESFDDILHRLLTSESSHGGSPPASQECIDRLPRTRVVGSAEAVALGGCCGILHEPFEEGDVAVSLACGHSYKEEAILTWLRSHNTCPICRLTCE